jgi:rRNA biogenesis protein RRP5
MAYVYDHLGADAGRKIIERAVRSVSISNENDKMNLWIAFMNFENNFGNQDSLQKYYIRFVINKLLGL